MRLFFHRGERLRSEKAIQSLFRKGKSGLRFPFRYLYRITTAESSDPVRIAFIVPKRRIRKSVDRNLIRRRMREAYRRNKHILHLLPEQKSFHLEIALVWVAPDALPYLETEQKLIVLLQHIATEILKDTGDKHPG
ncbi:MAG TPA: ribonuclease P protein component [Bacteroidales bacterium]|nr:ribonuclease P protein component [Bacteroidales bacterium]HRZ48016.1 ribonuclease P protein component [Bacteroidales bacterium]